jgi:hypothetical protein
MRKEELAERDEPQALIIEEYMAALSNGLASVYRVLATRELVS